MISDRCGGLQSGFLTTMVNSLSLCLVVSSGDKFKHCGLAGHKLDVVAVVASKATTATTSSLWLRIKRYYELTLL